MAKKWRDLVAPIMADPVRREHIEAGVRAADDVMILAKLRDECHPNPDASTGDVRASQSFTLHMDHERDLYLSTLAGYIADMGGRLEIRAVFPDQVIELALPPEPEPAAEKE